MNAWVDPRREGDDGMDPRRGDLDCDSSRAGLMRLQGQRGPGRGGGGVGGGGELDLLSSNYQVVGLGGGLHGTACNWAFFFCLY